MPTCGPDYANVGYKEYFNTSPPGPQYVNTVGSTCVQYCSPNTRANMYGNTGAGGIAGTVCTEAVCTQTCANYSLYGVGNPAAQDDCSQYYNYSNCTNYTRNISGAGSVLPTLGLNQSLIDGIVDVPTSITAIQHLRDKMSALIDIKLRQTTVNSVQSSSVADSTFNDNNPATREQVVATQYNALKSKLDSFWQALKTSGASLGNPTSVPARTASTDPVLKTDITALKNDLVAIADACTQSYANYQNLYGYANANTYCSNQIYGRTAVYTDMVCTQYACVNTGSGCGQYNHDNYSNCTNRLACTNYFNTAPCWNYSNHSNHSNHSNYTECENCRRDN